MPAKQSCAQYKYVVTSSGPKIVAVSDHESKDEESPADYNAGGYLPIKVSDVFKDGRYTVVRKLGWGHFSTVWLVKDSQEKRHSALKVVKSAGRYAETARDEIQLLSKVAEANPLHPGRSHIVSFLDSFEHNGPEETHVCIVFEPLGENLLSLIERNKKKGVPVPLVKTIARQVLLGLEYLHDECDLVHTDIKPENILVAIPEVEYHINTELSTSPTPTSRRVGVPPPKSRAGVTIPRQRRSRERHVQIFDSQPLSSPPSRSGSANNSLNTSAGAAASIHAQIQKLALSSSAKPTTNDLPPIEVTPVDKVPVIESPDSSPVSVISSTSTSILFTCQSNESTPPTSFGSHGVGTVLSRLAVLSAKEQLKLKAEEHEKEKLKRLDRKRSPERISLPVSKNTSPVKEEPVPVPSAPIAIGPSLLSQTAPRRSATHSPASSISSDPSSSPQKASTISLTPSVTPRPALFESPISVKIADLGNASPSTKHYTEDIQTRQYRSPEAIIGRKDWGARADIWSVACVIFELLATEYLFDPQAQGQLFTKDDDHMAQIIELMGDFSLEAKMGGKYSRELFDHTGALRYIRTLKPWPLKRVMMEKYLYNEKDAMALCDFLEPMLAVDQRDRKEARDMVGHPWMNLDEDEWIEDW
ncbi:hypothetical protein PILCRDRAFT_817513 [Piloderma croceum F 1598]|uniref:non-specific serine/threonine protein kinase n=1 Tax=Piloderma croceum (strain F 1598) TaxID=765440 RepID=A0A0C3G4A0_PILCF|nr:hypothetical protein PILCRDRAFT_817513 [Piloderma croceum F 1598]